VNPIKLASRATTALVAAVAGFSSYQHIVEVAYRAGEHPTVAAVIPLSIDGLIVVGTMAMVEDKRADRRPRLSARVALGFGVVATLAANIASAQPHFMSRCVAAVPAVAFLITVEVLARSGRKLTAGQHVPAVVPVEAARRPPSPGSEPAEAAPELVGSVPTAKPVRAKRQPSSRDKVIAAHRRTPDASDAALAARLKVSEVTVKRHRPAKAVDSVSTNRQVNGRVPELQEVGHVSSPS
jgi:hypothetical protein